uniref:Glycosyl transferase CAP10 domain-containing protein n=1 Tax=viral metagenome TaxID=1070528 RepID=A0A6C0AZI1_9ZZZZ
MSFTVKKENGELIINDMGGFETRNSSTIWCLQEADKLYHWNDFKEIRIYTGDFDYTHDIKNIHNEFSFSKRDGYYNLVPDFNFHSWPQVGIDNYKEFVEAIDKAGLVMPEINKVGWIGNITTAHSRRHLLEIGQHNPLLLDIFDCGMWIRNPESPDSIKLVNNKFISTPDLVKKYSILIDIEGTGYSGRLKHLLWSHRPLLIVDRPHKEYFFEYMKEWGHYIPVKRDLSDLIEKTQWCLDNYDKALEIAENAYQFSKVYLTREACYKQWNKIITNII